MGRRRRDLFVTGINDLSTNPVRSYVLGLVSLVVICGPCMAIGSALDDGGGRAESISTGMGLAIWVLLFVWYTARGGLQGIRDRRLARRREEHIQEIRDRRRR